MSDRVTCLGCNWSGERTEAVVDGPFRCCPECHCITQEPRRTPRERWGSCCPSDPECSHSFLDNDAVTAWMDKPITDAQAATYEP